IPEPSADQLLPFHLAMKLAVLPPALLNRPPAYTSLPDTASAYTMGGYWPPWPPQHIPEPSADQLLPFHLAMIFAPLSPAVVNTPPAYTSPPDTASAYTERALRSSSPIPEPSADQLLPFHLTI